MNIPKSFKLNGKKFIVKEVNMDKEDLWGRVITSKGQIDIHPDVPDRERGTVFYHELTHAILDHMGEHELSKSERFVDGFAQLMNEYEISQRGVL